MKRKIWLCTLIISCVVIMFSITAYAQKISKKTVTDFDGNIYHTVTIGKQIWMVENLKTTHYRNGDPILHAPDDIQWFNAAFGDSTNRTGAYCNFDNDENNGAIYGRLYNSYVVIDKRGICPKGWHIPAKGEWKILETYLGGETLAGGKLKEAGTSHWINPNIGATNESGFSALPGGFRFRRGPFASFKFTGYLWSSGWTGLGGEDAAWFRLVNYSAVSINKNDYTEGSGFSVRCLKD